MKYLSVLPLVILLLLFNSLMAKAQENNDPFTQPDANACFEGGSMAGMCNSEWAWTCGWYLIRLETSIILPAEFPAECQSLLSGEPESPEAPWIDGPAPQGCYAGTNSLYSITSSYFWWPDTANTGEYHNTGLLKYSDPQCTDFLGSFGNIFVSAADLASAEAWCATHTPRYASTSEVISAYETGAWAIYICIPIAEVRIIE